MKHKIQRKVQNTYIKSPARGQIVWPCVRERIETRPSQKIIRSLMIVIGAALIASLLAGLLAGIWPVASSGASIVGLTMSMPFDNVGKALAQEHGGGLEDAVAGLAYGDALKAHCSAVAIDLHWVVSASPCVQQAAASSWDRDFGLDESEYDASYAWVQRERRWELQLESYIPEKMVAYFYSPEPLRSYLDRGSSRTSPALEVIYADELGRVSSHPLESAYFRVWESLLYYPEMNLPSQALGGALINSQGAYVGLHLGYGDDEDGERHSVGINTTSVVDPYSFSGFTLQGDEE